MLYNPPQSWGMRISNTSAQRISSSWGSGVTPGVAPSFGSWATLISGSSVPSDIYEVDIMVHAGATSATTRNVLMDIGIDPSGGTSFTTIIPYLMCGHAGQHNSGTPIFYRFPLYIPAGASIGARAMGTVATAFYVSLTALGKPSNPDAICCGTKVVSFGETTASATGTTVTAGTTSDGAWTQLGSALTVPLWWWQTGITATDTTMTAQGHTLDLGIGDSSDKQIALLDVFVSFTASESICNVCAAQNGALHAAVGQNVYGRVQCAGTPDSALSMMAWGLG